MATSASLVGLEFYASCRAERISLGMICWCCLKSMICRCCLTQPNIVGLGAFKQGGRRPSVVYAETLLTVNGFGLSITRILNILSKMQVK